MIVLDLGPRPDKDIQLRAKDCPVLPKGEGSFRAESATSSHPYRLGPTIAISKQRMVNAFVGPFSACRRARGTVRELARCWSCCSR